jgi:hypothetical protein
MNEKLSEAIARLQQLPEDRQEAAAMLLIEFLDREDAVDLTPQDLAALERYLDELVAEKLVKDFFERARAQRDRSKT